MPPLEQTLLTTAALSAIMSVSLTIYLLALRFVPLDLVPALPHIHRWRRHARPCLSSTLAISATTLLLRVN